MITKALLTLKLSVTSEKLLFGGVSKSKKKLLLMWFWNFNESEHYSAFLPTNSCFEDPDQNKRFFHETEIDGGW